MISFALALALAGSGSAGTDTPRVMTADASPHFEVTAHYRPGKAAGTGEVAVTFAPKDPDVKINTTPPPRLKLDEGQKLLAEKTAPRKAGAPDEKYLDLTFPVVFPVAVTGPLQGEQTVKGALTYYYCSHREGWCRKGTADVEIPVKAR
jgi:hypothetical protein